MSDTSKPLNETVLNDVLVRVQALENQLKDDVIKHTQDYIGTLDSVAFSMTVAIDVISKILIEKELVTKEALEKTLDETRKKITEELDAKMKEHNLTSKK